MHRKHDVLVLQHHDNDTIIYFYAECRYSKYHYAECLSVEKSFITSKVVLTRVKIL
jgi:hypothetical protein